MYIEFSIIVFLSFELSLIKRICFILFWYIGIENKKKRNIIGFNYLRVYFKLNDMLYYRIFIYKLLNIFILLLCDIIVFFIYWKGGN